MNAPSPSALRRRRTAYLALAIAVLTALSTLAFVKRERLLHTLFPNRAAGMPIAAKQDDEARAHRLTRDLSGYVVWSSNRFGNHDLLMLSLPDWKVTRLTTHPHPEYFARISPDGQRIVFARARAAGVSQRKQEHWDVYLLDLGTGGERRIAERATTPTWSADGRKLYFVRASEAAVYEYDLRDRRESVLLQAGRAPLPAGVSIHEPEVSPRGGQIALTLRGATRMTALTSDSRAISRFSDGCQLAWSPDASFLYWIDYGGRQENLLMRRDLAGGEQRPWLDLPEPFSHEYFPRMSRDGRYLILGASAGGHEHDLADYEIFLWRIGTPAQDAVRLTYHSGNDNWPDIYLRAN